MADDPPNASGRDLPAPPPLDNSAPFVLDYRHAERARRPRDRFGPIGSFFAANFITAVVASLVSLAFLPSRSAMNSEIPCMVCGTFASGAVVSTLAFACGIWIRSRFTPYGLSPRPWWVSAFCGSACAVLSVSTQYLPERLTNVGGAALILLCPALFGCAVLRKPEAG